MKTKSLDRSNKLLAQIKRWMSAVVLTMGLAGLAAPAQATTVNFPGRGVSSALISDCTPVEKDDWMDGASVARVTRRVLPRDCVISLDNPPVFSWVDASAPARDGDYQLLIQRFDTETFSWVNAASLSTALPRATLGSLLSPGTDYRWQVTYNDAAAASAWRRFQISPNALPSVIPDGTTAYTTAQTKAHPRLLPAGASWNSLWSAAQGSDLAIPAKNVLIDAYRNAISRNTDGTDPTPISQETALHSRADYSSDADFVAYQAGIEASATQAATNLRTEAFASRLAGPSGEYTSSQGGFLADAKARMLALAGWNNGSTSHENNDQANRVIYVALAVAYDLLYNDLSDTERSTVKAAIRDRLTGPLDRLSSFDSIPYRSHEANTLSFTLRTLALTAETSSDEQQDMQAFIDTWNAFATLTSVWGEYDGATGNGVTYGWTDFLAIPEALLILKTACNVDFLTRSWFQRAVDNFIALTPPGQTGPAAFGDSNASDNFASYAHHAVRLHPALAPRGTSEWYWPLSVTKLKTDDVPFHLLALGLNIARAAPLVPPNNFVFPDAGHTAFHTDIGNADGQRSSVFFRSSRFGAWNHSHADQNSFVYYSRGVPLFISGGYYDYYGSPHHLAVTRATRYKNAVTFDGGVGQAQASDSNQPEFSMNAFGALLNAGEAGGIAVATGDAGKAYQMLDRVTGVWTPLVTNAIRSIAFNKTARVLLVYDYLSSGTPRRWEWNLQALKPFDFDGQSAILPSGAGHACASLHGANATFTQSSGFQPDPSPAMSYVPQMHGKFTQNTPSTQARTVLVIREDCATPLPIVSFPSSDSNSALVNFADGRSVTFSQAGLTVSY